uniref:Bromo domain-containing protein n=1 Tax=Naja naja TaxID=35670 RepID=A0A8C6XVZ4_NAJNA
SVLWSHDCHMHPSQPVFSKNQPDYYEVVSQPIDLMKIQQKLKMEEYDDVNILLNRLPKLWDLYLTDKKNEFVQKGEADEDEDDDEGHDNQGTIWKYLSRLKEILEQLLEAVVVLINQCYTSHGITWISFLNFQQYPDYYAIIKEPIDLKTIAQRIQNGSYKSIHAMTKDIDLLVKNAKTYNEPGSQVFKDANAIKKIFNMKKAEIEHSELTKSSLRVRTANLTASKLTSPSSQGKGSVVDERNSANKYYRNKRAVQGDRLSAITMTLQYGSESDEDAVLAAAARYEEGESEAESIASFMDTSNPLYQLYDTVRNCRNNQGQLISEPFFHLPSKKKYPDYYQQIKMPISLQQIRVLKLQQVMQAKKKELARRDEIEDGDSMISSATSDAGSSKRKSKKNIKKQRMKILYNVVLEAREPGTGRRLCELFMVKPSKKDYPDYYKIILEPMDLKIIEHNIRSDKYAGEEAMIEDMRLMFRNARHYNEEGSQVYNDAHILEKILKEKRKELGPLLEDDEIASPKLKLSNFIPRGRRLSAIFLRLPSRSELPDYYLTIKKPVDMEKIRSHMMANKYQDIDSMVEDFVMMFNNACTYNEPESLIYKDALVLHKVLLETRRDIEGDEDSHVPNVTLLIQELIHNLFVSVMTEIPAVDPSFPNKPPLTFDIIRRNVENNRYRRLDLFQEHMFEVLERARRMNRK